MTIKGIIFDLDGTLVDTKEEYKYEVFTKTMKYFKIEVTNQEANLFWYGKQRSRLIENKYNINPRIFWKKFMEVDTIDSRIKNSYVYEDVIPALTKLKDSGKKLGIVTGAPKYVSKREVELIEGVIFDSIINANHLYNMKVKPDPEGLIKCLNDLKLGKDELIFVGNGEEDILAGRNAGIQDVMIYRGAYQDFFKPTIIINSLNELKKLTEKHL